VRLGPDHWRFRGTLGLMRVSWKTEAPQWLLLAACLGTAFAVWQSSPDVVPVHWGASGRVDRYGGRHELLILPAIAVGVYVLLLVLPRLDPRRAAYARFAGAYTALRVSVLVLLTALYAVIAFGSRDASFNPIASVACLIGAFFIVLGAVLGRLQPNFFAGIRTPWTLTSDRSWTLTHRAGGWVFAALGAVTVVCAFVAPGSVMALLAGGSVAAAVGLAAYSYFVWRDDVDRGHSPGAPRDALSYPRRAA
jgi:uncharacterized membrane protein